jgi:hypothetical protein
MFKALNPYMLVAMDTSQMPITGIWPGVTPEETELSLESRQVGGATRRHKWTDVAGVRYYNVKVNGRSKGNRALAEILVEYAKWMDDEVSKWKDPIPPRPWDPLDEIRQWFSPYLRVANVADLRQALADDVAMLSGVQITEP